MKKLFLILSLGLSLSAYSQIVVRETLKDSTVWSSMLTGLPKLTHFYDAEHKSYVLYYKNLEYQYITDVDYIDLGTKENTIEFFNILMKAFEEKKELTLELDKNIWFLNVSYNMVNISTSGSRFFLTKKNLENISEALSKSE